VTGIRTLENGKGTRVKCCPFDCLFWVHPSETDRADLADRAVTIHLATLTEDARDPEDELLTAFERKRPAILGALFDAVSAALRNLSSVKLDRAPRMADFAKWITAAESGLWLGRWSVHGRLSREPP
jgi:hypothetical protein